MKKSIYWKILYQTIKILSPIFLWLLFKEDTEKFLNKLFETTINNSNSYTEVIRFLVVQFGVWILPTFLSIYVLKTFREANSKEIFNTKNSYIDIPYFLIVYSSKVLGFRKCKLARVPIYLQFKFIFNDTFSDFCHESIDNVQEIDFEVRRLNTENMAKVINIVISDTYKINVDELPKYIKGYTTIVIERTKKPEGVRSFNAEFLKTIRVEIHQAQQKYRQINLFLTTNPQHSEKIVNENFKLGRTRDFSVLIFKSRNDNSFDDKYYELK